MLPPQGSDLPGEDLSHLILVPEEVEGRDHLTLVDVLQRDATFVEVLDIAKEWLEVDDVDLLGFQPS